MSATIGVLGAGGFIGGAIAARMALAGTRVLAATRRPTAFAFPGIVPCVAEYDSARQFHELVQQSSLIIHAASISTPGSSESTPQIDGNLRTTLALLEALQQRPQTRLLYFSSGGTLYGSCSRAAVESDPLRPRSYHGAGKAAAEQFIHAYSMQYGGSAVILRPSNVYGPGQLAKPGFGIIPTAFGRALGGQPLTVWGSGDTVRDYLYIDDLVELCLRLVACAVEPGTRIYNVSRGVGTTLTDLLDAIDAITGRPLRRLHQPPRAVDVASIIPDSSAAQQAFDWRPAVTLTQGLEQTWRWLTRPH